MALLSRLLPQGSPLHLETWHLDEVAAQLILRVTSRQALVHCPGCRFPTRRIHSYDERTLADLPWAHKPRQHFLYASAELTRLYPVDISSASNHAA